IDGLPPWLYGTVGGNTPCVCVEIDGMNEPIIFDCGSGLRKLGIEYAGKTLPPQHYHIFLSHFHWDHLQGLPFFNPAYNPAVTLDFYSPNPALKDALFGQMDMPYFPIELGNLASTKNFIIMDKPLEIGSVKIDMMEMNHPGTCSAFKVSQNGKSFIYATDTELSTKDFLKNEKNNEFFKDVDLIVLDSQYTLGEAIEKYNWGHSAFSISVDFAVNWGIKHLVLFHHDPEYDDRKLYGMLQSSRWYLQRMNVKKPEISLAMEGMEITL
ncbi:MAG: MBL fold metallo-hydrolase, partial [Treponema sp.]|nr:MBL fold metallo-hydrolase [Treponema sp.]